MKILHVYTGGGEIYGAERVIFNLAIEQIKRGFDTKVVYFKRSGRNSFLESLHEHGIPVYVIPSTGKLDIGAFLALRRICLDSPPQILHSHGYKGYIFSAILKRISNSFIIVSTKHISTDSSSRIQIYDYLGDTSLKFFDWIIAVSDFTKESLVERHIPADKIEVIHNGVDIPINGREAGDRLRSELKLGPDSKLIGFIGRLTPQKGISYLLEAARIVSAETKDIYFVLIGDGELREDTESFISSNNLEERVLTLGWRKDATELLRDIDILLLPSLFEGTPMIMLESMALGVPVVGSAVGGISEVIEDRESGLLIKPCDPDAIVSSIHELLENRELAEKISRNSIEEIKTRYSSEHMTEMYNETYTRLLSGVTAK